MEIVRVEDGIAHLTGRHEMTDASDAATEVEQRAVQIAVAEALRDWVKPAQ